MIHFNKAILIAVAALCFHLSFYAQGISLNISNITVKSAMEQLKKTSGYSFVFSSIDVNTKKHVSISVENVTIEEVVKQILSGQDGLSYEIRDKKIIVKRGLPATAATPGKEKVTGKVIDINGDPVTGATIKETGTSNGTVTDMDGRFSLEVNANAILEISYIGYETQKVQAQSGKALAVTMKEDTRILDEVVVIGYGTTTRREFTGSVTSLKLENSPVALASNTNALEFLKGNISGLDIGATNTAGGQPSVLIRGQTSISGENTPLIIVDGVIFMGIMNDINPNDVASVDVLKDATSAAAYGSRSANGVVIITTKRGKQGKPVIHLNVTGSLQNWHRQPKLMKGEQYLNMICDKSGFKDYGFLTPQERMNYEAGRETDWLNEATRTGWIQDHQIAISGAGEKMNYYLSTSRTDNQGIVIGDNFSRRTLFGKINTGITDWLQTGVDVAYAYSDYSGVGADINKAILLAPYDMVYRDADRTLLEKYPTGHNEFENPLWGVDSDNSDDKDLKKHFRMNAYLVVKLPWVEGLSYRLNYSGYVDAVQNGRFYHESYYVPVGPYDDDSRYSESTQQTYLGTANGYFQNETTNNWIVDNILNYKNTFQKHAVDLTAVATRDRWVNRKDRMEGRDFLSNGNTLLGMDGLHYATTQKNNTNIIERKNAGYFARASYSYDNACYLTGSYRRDGASVFGADNKWGNFFAFGGAWKISRAKFMEKVNFLNDMKIKLSWGRNGNQGLPPYGTLSQVAVGSAGGLVYPFGNTGLPSFGIKQTTLGNSKLAWETTDSWNTGFESTWLNNRLFIDLDIYFTRTYDQIFNRTIPVMSGFNVMSSSMGEVANRGVELSVHSVNIQKKDWRWDSNLVFWLNRNKLIHLYGEDMNNDGKEDDDLENSLFIGHSIHAIYGYKQDGIVQKDDVGYMEANNVQPGTPKYVDMDGDEIITVNDRTIVGNRDPRFKMSLSNTISWKNLEWYVMLTGTFGGKGYYQEVNNPAFLAGGGGGGQYSNNMYIPYWKEDRPSNKYPIATFQGDDRFLGVQSRAFVRLQDVTLSYSFDMPCIRKIGIQTLRVFFTGRNLATITGWKGGDPEMGNVLLSGVYPVATTFSLGTNVSF